MDREGDGGLSEARRVRDKGLSWAVCPELRVPGSSEDGGRGHGLVRDSGVQDTERERTTERLVCGLRAHGDSLRRCQHLSPWGLLRTRSQGCLSPGLGHGGSQGRRAGPPVGLLLEAMGFPKHRALLSPQVLTPQVWRRPGVSGLKPRGFQSEPGPCARWGAAQEAKKGPHSFASA